MLFHRVITQYPATLYAGMARLSRSVLALRSGREEEAIRHLDDLVRSSEPAIIDADVQLLEALAVPAARAHVFEHSRQPSAANGNGRVVTSHDGVEGDSLERFAARLN